MDSDADVVQASITSFWNIVAPHYEEGPGNTAALGSDAYKRWIDLMARVLPGPSAEVLDVGTGTGFLALQAAALGHNVVGIDLSVEMLEVARKQASARDLSVRFEEADAVNPPFGPATFDAITCRYLLWTLRDATRALSNWRRILRPGGRIIVVDGFREPQPAREIDPEDLFGRHYRWEVQAAIPFFGVQQEEPVVTAFREAGFALVQLSLLDPQFVEKADEPVRPYIVVAVQS
jgi:ubiquinone/menaquinone biosynthesis C-methylase UbiE